VSVAANLAWVRQRMDAAARRAGRDPAGVRLVAVSKTRPPDDLRQAMAAGQMIFGENYVQELQAKAAAMGAGPRWHFIGALQSNKARLVAQLAEVVHSVDRPKLAAALGRQAQELGKELGVLVQVSLAGEAQKAGCAAAEAPALCQLIAATPGLRLLGLMTMPPFFDEPERARPIFAELRRLARRLAADLPSGAMNELSMGMSGDFEVAIEEGATLARVGTDIFGRRG